MEPLADFVYVKSSRSFVKPESQGQCQGCDTDTDDDCLSA